MSDVWSTPTSETKRGRARWPFVLVALGLAGALFAGWWASQNLFCGFTFTRGYTVPSPSMEPTIRVGDRIRVIETQSIDRGDVIVFESPPGVDSGPARNFIRRIVAVGGDSIESVGGRLKVNGAILDERYVDTRCGGPLSGPALQPQTIPDGHVFVLGDNRCASRDSRVYGPIPLSSIVGRVCDADLHSP